MARDVYAARAITRHPAPLLLTLLGLVCLAFVSGLHGHTSGMRLLHTLTGLVCCGLCLSAPARRQGAPARAGAPVLPGRAGGAPRRPPPAQSPRTTGPRRRTAPA